MGRGLIEEAGQRLAAVALAAIVRANEKGVDVRAVAAQSLLEGGMDGLDIGGCVETESDAALVGEDDDAQAGPIEAGDCIRDAGEDVKVGPRRDIAGLPAFSC